MDITGDGNVINTQDEEPAENENPIVATQPSIPSVSYSTAAQVPQNTGAIPKNTQLQQQHQKHHVRSEQISNILINHNDGNRILIIMRGLPGSGKTHLAKQLVDMLVGPNDNYKTHIFSTDDFFMVRGQYQHDKYKLPEAHDWNHKRVAEATKMGVSPVIVDNTNVELWEMEPYLRFGVRNGYIIEVMEPTTPWAKKIHQLAKKNTHNVPLAALKRMSENYYQNITGTNLKQAYELSYPSNMVPPVKRNIPPLITSPVNKPSNSSPVGDASNVMPALPPESAVGHLSQQYASSSENEDHQINEEQQINEEVITVNDFIDINDDQKTLLKDHRVEDEDRDLLGEDLEKRKLYLEAQKRLEEIEKVEHEWENGEEWDSGEQASAAGLQTNKTSEAIKTPASAASQIASIFEAKPQRRSLNSSPRIQNSSQESQDSMMQTVNECQDWSKISMFMPPWTDTAAPSASNTTEKIPIQTMSSSTCLEFGDTDINGKFKVISATSRNINEFHISMNFEKIPEKRMLDKSSMTNETIITESFRCDNEEKHFVAFRKLFPNIARSDLRDIFDKCCGDVNWAVEIVLDGMNNKLIRQVDKEELSDEELETMEQCQCLAKYNIIPNANTVDVQTTNAEENKPIDENNPVAVVGSVPQKKKRDATMSDENIQIKRQIEQNVVISDDHYSKHCLMIRKLRRGEPTDKNVEEPSTSEEPVDTSNVDSNNASNIDSNETASVADDTDDDNECNFDNGDRLVTVTLGFEFVRSLDEMYGRTGMEYPENILPRVTLPISALNELNALWMESLMSQLDEHARKTAAMVQQDEEFAR